MARPTKRTPEIITKLEQAFAIGCDNREACIYAEVPESTFYAWTEKDPELLERFHALKERPILKAKQRVVKGIDESYNNAMDYLKRKKRLEFGDNIDHTTDGEPLTVVFDKAFNNE